VAPIDFLLDVAENGVAAGAGLKHVDDVIEKLTFAHLDITVTV
jgi:hypothetical protein